MPEVDNFMLTIRDPDNPRRILLRLDPEGQLMQVKGTHRCWWIDVADGSVTLEPRRKRGARSQEAQEDHANNPDYE